jgi:hypothetical protein
MQHPALLNDLTFKQSCQEMQFDWQEASFEFPIAADSSLFVIPAPWFVYTTYVRL